MPVVNAMLDWDRASLIEVPLWSNDTKILDLARPQGPRPETSPGPSALAESRGDNVVGSDRPHGGIYIVARLNWICL